MPGWKVRGSRCFSKLFKESPTTSKRLANKSQPCLHGRFQWLARSSESLADICPLLSSEFSAPRVPRFDFDSVRHCPPDFPEISSTRSTPFLLSSIRKIFELTVGLRNGHPSPFKSFFIQLFVATRHLSTRKFKAEACASVSAEARVSIQSAISLITLFKEAYGKPCSVTSSAEISKPTPFSLEPSQ